MVYEWEDVVYLSGFVGVFHSGGLLYVDFCCIHTSRLGVRVRRKSENHDLICHFNSHDFSCLCFALKDDTTRNGEGTVSLPLYEF